MSDKGTWGVFRATGWPGQCTEEPDSVSFLPGQRNTTESRKKKKMRMSKTSSEDLSFLVWKSPCKKNKKPIKWWCGDLHIKCRGNTSKDANVTLALITSKLSIQVSLSHSLPICRPSQRSYFCMQMGRIYYS